MGFEENTKVRDEVYRKTQAFKMICRDKSLRSIIRKHLFFAYDDCLNRVETQGYLLAKEKADSYLFMVNINDNVDTAITEITNFIKENKKEGNDDDQLL